VLVDTPAALATSFMVAIGHSLPLRVEHHHSHKNCTKRLIFSIVFDWIIPTIPA
jgi:hypothetical protein